MVEKLSGIYKILNTKNNKVYIGSSKSIKERWHNHKSELDRNTHVNPHLQSSWNYYGNNSFLFLLLNFVI